MMGKPNILFNRFVKLVEDNHQAITEAFMNDLLKNADTDAYRSMDRAEIYEASDTVYRDLSTWIAKSYPKERIEERYLRIGKDRFDGGVPFAQVQKAMTLQKRHLWLFVMDKLYDDATAYREALELNNRVVLYFDRATFYMLKAYQRELGRRI